MAKVGETTVGNHSYIDVFEKTAGGYIDKGPYDRLHLKEVVKLLKIIDKFEKEHPELKIINWRAEYLSNEGCNKSIQGLWIDHQARVPAGDS